MRQYLSSRTGEESFGSGAGLLIDWCGGVGLFYCEFQPLEEKNVGGVETAFLVVVPDWAFEFAVGLDGVDPKLILFAGEAVGGSVVARALRCVGWVLEWGVAG
jgi:hypothetical protein